MTESIRKPITLASYLKQHAKKAESQLLKAKSECLPEAPIKLTTLANFLNRQRDAVIQY